MKGVEPMAELEPRNFVQPCLLLLLREHPDHGYELVSRLRPMHDGDGDAGGVYRALRGMERQGLVRSEWHTSDVGPAKRTYFVTADGVTVLDELVASLCQTHEALHVFLERYARITSKIRGIHEGRGHDQVSGHAIDGAGVADRGGSAERCGRCGGVRPTVGSDRPAGW
ncbi:PadR family transcriptional regulator [Pseudonocardia sp. DLS-67]